MMDASHPKTPTVIPLTRSLLKQLMKQQQQRLLTGGQAAQRSAPLLATQGQAPGEAQSGGSPTKRHCFVTAEWNDSYRFGRSPP